MRRLLLIAVSAGMLMVLSACTSTAVLPSTEPSANILASSSEDGNVGVCHSLSVELMTLDAVNLGYDNGDLDRRSFDYMVTSIAEGFPLLGILHRDATLSSEIDSLRSAIRALATDGAEPGLGDASPLGKARTAITDACESAGAPLSVYQ